MSVIAGLMIWLRRMAGHTDVCADLRTCVEGGWGHSHVCMVA